MKRPLIASRRALCKIYFVKFPERFLVSLLCAFCGISNARVLPTNAVQIDTNYPSGNIVVEKITGDTVNIRPDLRDTEGKWFYWCFRVRGAAGKTLTFKFTEVAPVGVRGPAVSLDEGATWKWLGAQTNRKSFTY